MKLSISVALTLMIVQLMLSAGAFAELTNDLAGRESQISDPKWTAALWEDYLQQEEIADSLRWAIKHRALFESDAILTFPSAGERHSVGFYRDFFSGEKPEEGFGIPEVVGTSYATFFESCLDFIKILSESGSVGDITFESGLVGNDLGFCIVNVSRPDRTGTQYIMWAERTSQGWIHRNNAWSMSWD